MRLRYLVPMMAGGIAVSLTGPIPAGAAAPSTAVGGVRRACTIVGTAGSDRLRGTSGNDVICGRGGNDTIDGAGGNDVIDGGAGNDNVKGGTGSDLITGGTGNDLITGGIGSDLITGGDGNDLVTGGDGNDRIELGSGDDRATGDAGDDRIDGGAGDDRLNGGPGADYLEGGAGINTCLRDATDTSPATSCSDLKAPVLHTGTAAWADAATGDNATARTLRLRMRVTDDRAGVRFAMLRYSNGPTEVRFVSQALLSGTTTDGVHEFRATVPAFAPAGEYRPVGAVAEDRVNRLTTAADLTALPSFTVTGASDLTAPAADVSSVRWVTPTTLDNSTAHPLRLRMRVTDDRAGVGSGYVIVSGNNDGPAIYLKQPHLVSGTATDGVWEFSGSMPASAAPGEWMVNSIELTDRVGRESSASATEVALTVTGVADVADPVADLSSARWMTPRTLDNGADRAVRLRVRLTDDLSGIRLPNNWTLALSPVDDPSAGAYMSTMRLISGTATDGVWEFSGTLEASSPAGVWHVRAFSFHDGVGHATYLTDVDQIPTFTVTEPRG
ncbi:calcium-binding protein [Paractinoplanes atraurantiacus]|uniref:Hemolysin-type calcium-binding repeat-containing protein n=1 Tax=Paractinoplanes atraurantiacus TaxID=1036182 RepID=A0A285IWW7_9ACTN|nr:calcium-binding protein [Actinoplanes atraurantiacus]SNY52535.1 Hemolysin-type calcium-binding repeat-containing protein [Actinoplanes atraurantiacus]